MSPLSTRPEEKEPLQWPPSLLAAFGTWDDVPEVEVLPANHQTDSPRESWD